MLSVAFANRVAVPRRRRWPTAVFVLLALISAGVAAFVADPPARPATLNVADEAAPAFTVYSLKDGLSDEIWSTIGFDARGFPWAGSASSLSRFDGYRWTPSTTPDARSLVRDMLVDGEGMPWAIFEREGLAHLDGHAWTLRRGEVDGFLHRFSTTTNVAGEREYWVAHDAGLSQLRGGRWHADPGNATSKSGRAIAIEQTRSLFGGPRQWMASAQDGLWYRDVPAQGQPAPWQRFGAPELNRMMFTDLRRSVDRGVEELWALSYGGGLARITSDGIRMWRSARGELPSEALYSAEVTYSPQGERILWIASRAGLIRIRGDTLTTFDRRHGLPSDAVRGLKLQRHPDGFDVLWLATERGIARAALTESQWQTVSLLGASENGVFSLLLEPDGRGGERLWVGTSQRGIGVLQDGAWRYFNSADGSLPFDGGVRGTWRVAGPDGEPWRLLSLTGGVLLRVADDFGFSRIDVPWPTEKDEAAAFVLPRRHAGENELWFGTLRSGVHRLRAGEWTSFHVDGAADWGVIGMAEQIDANGRSWLWAASNLGLHRFDGQQWQALPEGLALPDAGYRSVALIPEGERTVLWASSNRHGVVRVDVTDPETPALVSGDNVPAAPDPTVYSVLRDSVGRIYVCTNNGVQQLTPMASGRGYTERVFRRRDGLVHDECNSNTQFIDSRDRYWVGTLGGLSVFDPGLRTSTGETRAKPLYFTGVRVDGEWRESMDGAPLQLAAGTRELQVEYALLSGLRETESTYRSQLVGFDPVPGEWGSEHSRSFSVLPPGRYELRVEARDYAGTPAAPRSLVIEVEPFWWQRAWVRLAGLVMLLLVGALAALLYNRNLRSRERRLKREVATRTTELHDANVRLTELSYLDPLTGAANRRRLMEAIDAAIDRAVEHSAPIGLIVVDVDHFKRYNDLHGHLAGDAALRAVAEALQSATREQDLVARFGGEEFACLLVDADIETVARIAERMRALVEALPPRRLGNDADTVTLSAGIVSRIPAKGEHADALLREADAAMYRAKRDGRNCVRRAGVRDAASPPAAESA